MPITARKNEGETWREMAARYGRAQGLERDVLADFDAEIARGNSERDAAFVALSEWDCLDYVPSHEEDAIERADFQRSAARDEDILRRWEDEQ